MVIDGVKITTDLPDLTREEAQRTDGGVDLNWTAHGEKFERIRRVTGYLVGTLDRWNNAKQAEERERVKHVREAFRHD